MQVSRRFRKKLRQKDVSYVDNGLLALDTGNELLLLDIDDEVSSLQVTRNSKVEVEVADGLRPLVRERILLRLLLRAGGSFLGGCGL